MTESREEFEKYYKAAGLHVKFIRWFDVTVGQNYEVKRVLFAVWEASRRYEKRSQENE